MELLPDEFFSTAAGGDDEMLVFTSFHDPRANADLFARSKLKAALRLPPLILVKWLRVDCFTSLDLSDPGQGWSLQVWQGLTACLHAVPSLQVLRVFLPRYPAPVVSNTAINPLHYRTCANCDPSALGSPSGKLHFHCSRCKCASAACPRRPRPATCVLHRQFLALPAGPSVRIRGPQLGCRRVVFVQV